MVTQTFTIGNGADTSFTISHLLGTRTPFVEVYPSDTPGEALYAPGEYSTEVLDSSRVRLTFGAAPAADGITIILFNPDAAEVEAISPGPPTNLFMDSFNLGNVALASVLAETFEVVRNGIPGSVTAVSIDDLTEQNSTVPGGSIGENTVIIYVTKADVAAFAIKDGTVLRVRNRRVRVAAIGDDGDNLNALTCSTAGIKF